MNTNWRIAHTGDWRASCQRADVAQEVYVEVVEGERTVALVVGCSHEHFGVDHADLDARTRLVRSAPALHEALRALLAMLTKKNVGFSDDEWPAMHDAQRAFVEASPLFVVAPGLTLDAMMRRRARSSPAPQALPAGIDSEGGAPD